VRSLFIAFLVLSATCLAQDLSDIHIDTVIDKLSYADGPVWSRDGYLVVSDVPVNKVFQFRPAHAPALIRADANGPMGNAYDADGRLYTCESHTRRIVRTDKKGKVEVLVDKYQGKRLNAPNDVVVRKDGQIYFTDPAFGNQQDARELDFFGIYHLSHKGELEVIAKPKGRPNGIALSPNGRILYVSNSDERNIKAYDLDHNGAASNERVFVSRIDGVPDGLRVDEKGNVYLAAAKLEIYTPEGKPLGSIVTGRPPTNLAFGDDDFGSLYITARNFLYRVRLNVKGSVQY
jgi:gluconolactonase